MPDNDNLDKPRIKVVKMKGAQKPEKNFYKINLSGVSGSFNLEAPSNATNIFKYITFNNDNSNYTINILSPNGQNLFTIYPFSVRSFDILPDMQLGFMLTWVSPSGTPNSLLEVGYSEVNPEDNFMSQNGLDFIGGNPIIVNSSNPGTMPVEGVASSGSSITPIRPILIGGRASSSTPTAITNGNLVQFIADSSGKIVNMPYSFNESTEQFTTGASPITAATTTQIFAAGGVTFRHYITNFSYQNTSATPCDISIADGASVVWTVKGCLSMAKAEPVILNVPLKGTSATALNIITSAAGSVTINVQGYLAR